MTAVPAAIRTSPGPLLPIISALLSCSLERKLAGRLNDLVGQPLERDELATRIQKRLLDIPRPNVLPDEERSRRVRLESLPRVPQVVLVEEALDLDAEVVETLLDFRIDLRELDRKSVV